MSLVLLQTFLNHFQHAAVLADSQGQIVLHNTLFKSSFSKTSDLKSAFKNNSILLEQFEKIKDRRGSYFLRNIEIKLSDKKRKMDIETFPLIGSEGDLEAVAFIFFDYERRAPFQEHEKRLEKVGALTTIASGLAHEIKNPLSGIRGASQILSKSLKKDKELLEYAQIINEESKRVDFLVRDLLDFTKPRQLHKKQININETLHQVISLQRTVAADHIFIKEEFDPSLPKLEADEDALKQVFLNIIKNSRQSIRDEGEIKVRSYFVTQFKVKKGHSHKALLGIDISDNGSGMTEEVKKNLFTPYYTTKAKGTGLGLALCHQIIEEHEGNIIVESEIGKGTCFSIHLPL